MCVKNSGHQYALMSVCQKCWTEVLVKEWMAEVLGTSVGLRVCVPEMLDTSMG